MASRSESGHLPLGMPLAPGIDHRGDTAIVVAPGERCMSDDRLARIESKLDNLTADVGAVKLDVAVLKTDVGVLKTGQNTLEGKVVELGDHMRALHQDVVDRIKAIAEDDGRIEMNRRFDEVLQAIRDHSIPGDAADRYFARKINEHDRRLDALEGRS
ncbi:MAG TPA: hypothetical protein VMM93_00980 [Vicinamibacterales bacterium]|nr:hypothetical protein [Vicinamibacterales bacterium]